MTNIFILCAGRSASTALAKALQPLSNYTAAHESRCGVSSDVKLDYPENHIEIDNRLIWFVDLLDEKYGSQAKYVYLHRDLSKIAMSYSERWHLSVSIVKAYGHGILMKDKIASAERLDVCMDYANVVDRKIRAFLKTKENSLIIDSDNLSSDFDKLLGFLDAQGDLNACKKILETKHNLNKTNWLIKQARKMVAAVR
jgi:hypothetical protein